MCSICLDWSLVRLVCHAGHAYSNIELYCPDQHSKRNQYRVFKVGAAYYLSNIGLVLLLKFKAK